LKAQEKVYYHGEAAETLFTKEREKEKSGEKDWLSRRRHTIDGKSHPAGEKGEKRERGTVEEVCFSQTGF